MSIVTRPRVGDVGSRILCRLAAADGVLSRNELRTTLRPVPNAATFASATAELAERGLVAIADVERRRLAYQGYPVRCPVQLLELTADGWAAVAEGARAGLPCPVECRPVRLRAARL